MNELSAILLYLGLLLILILGIKAIFNQWKFSPIIGFILLGWALRQWMLPQGLVQSDLPVLLSWLAKIGIILLLFHVGIETNLQKVYEWLSKAGIIACSNMLLSIVLGYGVGFYFFQSPEIGIFIGFALAATSIGISTAIWGEKALHKSKLGALLLDIVTIDDVVTVFLVAFLLHFANVDVHWLSFLKLGGVFLLKIILFLLLCYLFSHFIEYKLITKLLKFEKVPDTILSMIGFGILIAAIATYFQFSYVIGAFLAGIAFSRDPRAIRMDHSMRLLLDLFVPFFFLWVGYQLVFDQILWGFFIFLLLAAVVGKVLGTYFPARALKISSSSALILSISTLPRAEIAMVIGELGHELGVFPKGVFSTLTLVILACAIITPTLFKAFGEHAKIPQK